MTWLQQAVRVRVPATSANLGPGFDAMGLALALHDLVEARVTREGLRIEVIGEGSGTAGAGEGHLVVRAMRAAFAWMGGQPPGLAVRCTNAIPHSRGLGSSSAAIVSGLLAARALVRGGDSLLPGESVFRLAVGLEGHPDNVAPCLAGGLTVAWTPRHRHGQLSASAGSGEPGRQAPGPQAPGPGVAGAAGPGVAGAAGPEVAEGGARLARVPVRDDLRAVVCVPPVPLITETARRALPPVVPHADAAANAARSALLVLALTSEPALVFDATEDFLHQRYRAAVMPETADLIGRLRRQRIAAVMSGAGPSVLVLTFAQHGPGPDVVDSIAAETGIAWHVIPLDVDQQGALVRTGEPVVHPPGSTRQGSPWSQVQGLDAGLAGRFPLGPAGFPRDTLTTAEGMPWPRMVLDWVPHQMPRGARCPPGTRCEADCVVGCGW